MPAYAAESFSSRTPCVIRRVHNRVSNNSVRRVFYLHGTRLLSTRTVGRHIDSLSVPSKWAYNPFAGKNTIWPSTSLLVTWVGRPLFSFWTKFVYVFDGKKKNQLLEKTGPRRYYTHFHFLDGNDTEEFGVQTTRVPVFRVCVRAVTRMSRPLGLCTGTKRIYRWWQYVIYLTTTLKRITDYHPGIYTFLFSNLNVFFIFFFYLALLTYWMY